MPFEWAVFATVAGVVVLVLLVVGAAVGRSAERRSRRGRLEFDTPAARRALTDDRMIESSDQRPSGVA